MSNEKTIHQKLFEYLAKEIHKFVNGLSPPIMDDFFLFRKTTHNVRNWSLSTPTR